MSKTLIRVLTAAISTVFAAVIGYLAYIAVDVNKSTIQTVNMKPVTADVGFTADAMIFRREALVLKEPGQSCYLFAGTGEKIGGGEAFAVCFDDEKSFDDYIALTELKNRLQLFRSVQKTEAGSSSLRSLNSEICSLTRAMSSDSGQGGLYASGNAGTDLLLEKILARKLCLGDSLSVSLTADGLEAEIELIERSISGETYLYAENSGYFSKLADGWEQQITPDKLFRFSFEDYRTAVSLGALPVDTDRVVGKMLYGYTWYLSFCTDREHADAVTVGDEFDVIIHGGKYELEVSSKTLSIDGSEALIIMRCDLPLTDISISREQRVTVICESYEGFKVPSEAIRVENGVTGVYVLEGTQAVYKPLEIIYSGEEYYLAKASTDDRSKLFLNDAVIIGGKDLYDGKVVY